MPFVNRSNCNVNVKKKKDKRKVFTGRHEYMLPAKKSIQSSTSGSRPAHHFKVLKVTKVDGGITAAVAHLVTALKHLPKVNAAD